MAALCPGCKASREGGGFCQNASQERRASARPGQTRGRKIATSFWGLAWCDHLECFSDFENRLPRGRTYIRNGSVLDLQIGRGTVKAIVSGSEIYKVNVKIKTLPAAAWKEIKHDCSQSIDFADRPAARPPRRRDHEAAHPPRQGAVSRTQGNHDELLLPRRRPTLQAFGCGALRRRHPP